MSFVVTEHYNATDVGVGAQLANVKAANPDAIFGMTVGTATGTLLRGLRDAGLVQRSVHDQPRQRAQRGARAVFELHAQRVLLDRPALLRA